VDPVCVATKLTGYRGSTPQSVTGVFDFLATDKSGGIAGRRLSSSGWRSQIKGN